MSILLLQYFRDIVLDQHNGVEVKHNGVNIENNRQSLLEFLNSIIGKKISIMWTALVMLCCRSIDSCPPQHPF